MKIGIDARLWNETGVGRYIRNLVGELQKIDQTNDYILFVREGDYETLTKQLAKKSNWKLVKADIHWHTLDEQIKFPALIKKERVDLMHFPYFSVPILYNRPYVVTIHDLILHSFSTGKASTLNPLLYQGKRLGYKYVIQKAAQKSKKVITVSQATKKEIVNRLGIPTEKIVVTYEGVDGKILESPADSYTPSRAPYFLYVGNVYPHKDVEKLLSAFQQLLSHRKEVKLIFVGKQDYFYERLQEEVVNRGIHQNIEFVGSITDEKLSSLYKNATALVIPSLMEGFGLPGLEAMAQRCLVIASDIPVFHEIYEDAAIYVNPTDVPALERALENTLIQGRSFYASQLEKAKKRVSFFSWEKMAKETLAVYESCVSLR